MTNEDVLVEELPVELLSDFTEFQNVVFADRLLTKKAFEALAPCELDGTKLEGLKTVLRDDKDAILWFDNDALVNIANFRGVVNPAIENEEASSKDRTLLGTSSVLVLVLMNDSASVIGSVEPTTGNVED